MAIHENLTRVPEQQLRRCASPLLYSLKYNRSRALASRHVRCRSTSRLNSSLGSACALRTQVAQTARPPSAPLRQAPSPFRPTEQALETAGLMLGSDKSRGYCLEMICEDFLAGANLPDGDPEALAVAVHRLVSMLSPEQRRGVLQAGRGHALSWPLAKWRRKHRAPDAYQELREEGWRRDGRRCQFCGATRRGASRGPSIMGGAVIEVLHSEPVRQSALDSGTIQTRSGCGGHQSNFEKAHESKALPRPERSEEEPVSRASSGQE